MDVREDLFRPFRGFPAERLFRAAVVRDGWRSIRGLQMTGTVLPVIVRQSSVVSQSERFENVEPPALYTSPRKRSTASICFFRSRTRSSTCRRSRTCFPFPPNPM